MGFVRVVKRMVRGDFSNPVSTLDAPAKDIKLGLALGESVDANMPLGELCLPFFTEGQELGFGSLDSAAVYKVFEAREGVNPDCSKRDYSGADTNNGRIHANFPFSGKFDTPTARATRSSHSVVVLHGIQNRCGEDMTAFHFLDHWPA